MEMEARAMIRARELTQPFSPEEFSSQIESKNVPAVFRGAVKSWKAISRWNPFDGGLDYLLKRVGSEALVEAMMSNHAQIFYGDLRSHERVSVKFSAFIESCKSWIEQLNDNIGSSPVNQNGNEKSSFDATCSISIDAVDKLYLAQVPIFSTEMKEKHSLQILREDIKTPTILAKKSISSINLWMNRAKSRSSIHYDPNHNILCIVSGRKEVNLWPPSASRFLYPMPVYGEASNHSTVNIENPDFSIHARAKEMKDYSEKVTLHPGDALFIPEGWYHQVDSDDLTIGVNFWWVSSIMSDMLSHMDAYYLRRILNRMASMEMDNMLPKRSISASKNEEICQTSIAASKDLEEKNLNNDTKGHKTNGEKKSILLQLEPNALQYLQELISLVHDNVKSIGQNHSTSINSYSSSEEINKSEQIANYENTLVSTDDILAQIFSSLEPSVLHKILLAMVESFPRTLEALILHVQGPASAEILTRKFDEMEPLFTKEELEEFYKCIYSVFDDPHAAMDAILNAKERFAFQAFENVLNQYLGVQVTRPS